MLHKILLTTLIGIVTVAGLLTVIQLWTPLLVTEVFVKLLITVGILSLLIGFIIVTKADLGSYKKLKDENYLD